MISEHHQQNVDKLSTKKKCDGPAMQKLFEYNGLSVLGFVEESFYKN
jgi:hypothetical protein